MAITRPHVKVTVRENNNDGVLQNAKVVVHLRSDDTLVNVYASDSGGAPVTGSALYTNDQGEAEGYLAAPASVRYAISDNAGGAYRPAAPGTPVHFTEFSEYEEVNLRPEDQASTTYVTAAIATHAGLSDPHPTYATDADLAAAIAGVGAPASNRLRRMVSSVTPKPGLFFVDPQDGLDSGDTGYDANVAGTFDFPFRTPYYAITQIPGYSSSTAGWEVRVRGATKITVSSYTDADVDGFADGPPAVFGTPGSDSARIMYIDQPIPAVKNLVFTGGGGDAKAGTASTLFLPTALFQTNYPNRSLIEVGRDSEWTGVMGMNNATGGSVFLIDGTANKAHLIRCHAYKSRGPGFLLTGQSNDGATLSFCSAYGNGGGGVELGPDGSFNSPNHVVIEHGDFSGNDIANIYGHCVSQAGGGDGGYGLTIFHNRIHNKAHPDDNKILLKGYKYVDVAQNYMEITSGLSLLVPFIQLEPATGVDGTVLRDRCRNINVGKNNFHGTHLDAAFPVNTGIWVHAIAKAVDGFTWEQGGAGRGGTAADDPDATNPLTYFATGNLGVVGHFGNVARSDGTPYGSVGAGIDTIVQDVDGTSAYGTYWDGANYKLWGVQPS